ncbi:MAG: LAGLIDADG homing endonuclease [Parcubacteria group bacterium GW2011_GWA1_50_14]|nr:MAG: LAGLIDADG homing endonuclease [Parcubacteria group bacterium GW2011_GWA1_50_14]
MGRMLSEVNKAYLAGLFDGDGAIMAFIQRHAEKKFGFRIRVIVKITQRNPEILEWVRKSTSFGSVVQNRTTYDWIVRDQKAIIALLKLLIKYFRVKKKQARIAIRILGSQINTRKDLLKIAELADALSVFNVRSQLRRRNFAAKIKESIPRND